MYLLFIHHYTNWDYYFMPHGGSALCSKIIVSVRASCRRSKSAWTNEFIYRMLHCTICHLRNQALSINVTLRPTKRYCHDNVSCKTNPRRDWPASGLCIICLVVHSAPLCNNKYCITGVQTSAPKPPLPPGSSNYAAITSIINNRYPLISNPVRPVSEIARISVKRRIISREQSAPNWAQPRQEEKTTKNV